MNIIFKNDTLFVDMEGENMEDKKEKIFDIVSGFEVNNVVINSGGNSRSNKKELNKFLNEYKERYDGNIVID